MKKSLRRAGAVVLAAPAALLGAASLVWAAPGDGPFKPPTPDSDAPGVAALQELGNAIAAYVIVGATVGFLLSLLIAVIGPVLGFDRAGRVGKIGMLVCVGVAFLLGLFAVILNWAYLTGRNN